MDVQGDSAVFLGLLLRTAEVVGVVLVGGLGGVDLGGAAPFQSGTAESRHSGTAAAALQGSCHKSGTYYRNAAAAAFILNGHLSGDCGAAPHTPQHGPSAHVLLHEGAQPACNSGHSHEGQQCWRCGRCSSHDMAASARTVLGLVACQMRQGQCSLVTIHAPSNFGMLFV